MKKRRHNYLRYGIREYKSKIIYLFDIVVVVIVFAGMYHHMPLDFSAGIFGQSEEKMQEINEYVKNETIPVGSISEIFKSSNVFNGGLVTTDYKYRLGRYSAKLWYDSGLHNSPTGMEVPGHILTEKNGKVYVEAFEDYNDEIYGTTEIFIKGNLYNEDDTLNYDAVRSLLARSDAEEITLAEAASLYPLIRDHILIGYADGIAWFKVYEDDKTCLIKSSEEKTEYFPEHIEGIIDEVYVVDNYFIIYNKNNDLHVYFYDEGIYKPYGLKNDPEKWGELKQIGYAVLEERGKYSVNMLIENYRISFKFTDSSMEDLYHERDEIKKSVRAMSITTDGNDTYMWLKKFVRFEEIQVSGF